MPVEEVQTVETPVAEAPALSITDEIAAHNARVDAETEAAEAETTSEEQPVETEDAAAAPAKEKPAEDDADDDNSGEEPPATENAAPYNEKAVAASLAVADLTKLAEAKKQIFDGLDMPADVKAYIDRQDALLADFSSQSASAATAVKAGQAIDKLYETNLVNGVPTPNAKPIVDYIFEDLRNEVPFIAQEIFERDSVKYPGMSVFQEKLSDYYGGITPEKMTAVDRFLSANAPLPVIKADRPAFVEEKNAEAWNSLSEPKRFSVEAIAAEIAELQDRQKNASEYAKEELDQDIAERKRALSDELSLVGEKQNNLNYQKAQTATAQRNQQQATLAFAEKVNTQYTTEVFDLADTFVKDLAPKLSFVDSKMQVPMARNMLARVQNALSFGIETDGSFVDDPFATRAAKELTEEGVKVDFKAARLMLQKHYSATVKVSILTERKASPKAIEIAQNEKRGVMNEIRATYKEVLGQIGQNTSASANKAIENKVADITSKRTVSRITPRGEGAGQRAKQPTLADINAEIKRFNVNVGDPGQDLYDRHAA